MEDNFNKHLGNKLKLRRLALGLTQTKVAKAINVTFQQIQKYEKGTNGVSSSRLMQISQFLKVKQDFFWRHRPESNWDTRICNPLRNHSATLPDVLVGSYKEFYIKYL